MKNDGIYRISPLPLCAVKGDAAGMGAKAFELSRLARLGLTVPSAFVLGTAHCRRWYRDQDLYAKNLPSLLEDQIGWLQSITGLGFGDPRKPLLVSVRSGAPVSMPGMMDTLLNVGLCDATVHGLLRMTGNPRLVWDSYRRLIQGYAEVVHHADSRPFVAALEEMLVRENLERCRDLDFSCLAELSGTYLQLFNDLTGRPFPQNPFDQVKSAVQAVFASWNSDRAREYRQLHDIDDNLYTAATIQRMVFGNAGGMSGAGVGFTRDPDTGENRLYFDFLFNSQGEDLVSGRVTGSDAERLPLALPEICRELQGVASILEREFRDVQEFEFTIQDGILYLLQTRAAKRTAWAALRIAVEQAGEGLIERDEAIARLERFDLGAVSRQRLSLENNRLLCQGQPAGIGVAIGRIVLDADAIARFGADDGCSGLLVRNEIATADIAAIARTAGVLTAAGNRTSHAAVVARQLGKPCITGCFGMRIDMVRRAVDFGERSLAEGSVITLDANSGCVYEGEGKIIVEYPTTWLDEIGKWR